MDASDVADKPATAAHVIGKWYAGGSWRPSASDSGSVGSGPQARQEKKTQSNGLQDHSQPSGKPLTMASAQDLVGMVEQTVREGLDSQRSDFEALLTQQTSSLEKFIGEQMKAHRLWSADNFHRVVGGIEAALQRQPGFESAMARQLSGGRSRKSPQAEATARPILKQSDSMITLDGPAHMDSMVTQVGNMGDGAPAVLLGVELEPMSPGSGWAANQEALPEERTNLSPLKGFPSEGTCTARVGGKFEQARRMTVKSEGERFANHLRIMTAAEEEGSAAHRFMRHFGWDYQKTRTVVFSKPVNFLVPIVESWQFSCLAMFFILTNALWIGIQTDHGIKNIMKYPSEENAKWYDHVDKVFTGLFTVEVLMRICAFQRYFIVGKHRAWNMYDSFLVCIALFEEFFDVVNISYLRAMRVLRLARVVRIVRVLRFFVGLRQLIMSVLGCAYVLSWASACIIFLMYLFAIVLLQGGLYVAERRGVNDIETMRTHYNGVIETMYTLLLAISNGALWEQLADELGHVWAGFRPLFALFMIFVLYGVLNVVTGVFVEKTAELKSKDRDLAIHKEMDFTKAFLDELRGLFEMKGRTAYDELGFEEFQEQLMRDDVQMYLSTQGIDVSEARELFVLLDVDQNEKLSMDEFVYGCQKLKGGVKSIDIIRLFERLAGVERKIFAASDHADANQRSMGVWMEKFMEELRKMRGEVVHLQELQETPR